MLRHKSIDRICCIVLAVTVLLTCAFMGAAATGAVTGERSIGYENRLFDQSRVHTIDIVMDDWDAFLETCTGEEYSACTVVIDGESFGSAAIRGKGNTSLSSVKNYGNDRYSFKIEFDHYQPGRTYHGLDKLSLNNLIQDKTYMKDYLAYTLMNKMGVAAPLCSFVQINVNGEAWGLYLAVEGVEDSFLSRNYGSDSGELYKPDSMSLGGGRGNGREFDMEEFSEQFEEISASMGGGFERFDPSQMGGFNPMQMLSAAENMLQMPEGFDPSQKQRGGSDRGFGGGMGSSDVMLQYTDDDPSSYSNIFGNAKTDVTEADQQRLIASLKALSEGDNVEAVVDTEAVIRYLVVHNFLCNGDSYTGSMVHNYYLYEEDGVLSMIPWDYNLAFGAFSMGGMGGSGATSTINSPIDSPVSSGELSSRPIISWIFDSDVYTARYHELYAEFVDIIHTSGWLAQEIERVSEMISPYVEAETRAFFTYDEFQAAVVELAEFCDLRAQSIAGQLNGKVPSTTDAQRADSAALIDASGVDLNAMGDFNHGGMGDASGRKSPFGGERSQGMMVPDGEAASAEAPVQNGTMQGMPSGFGGGMPQGMTPPTGDAASAEAPAQGGITPGMLSGFGGGMPQGMMVPGWQPGGEESAATVQPTEEPAGGEAGDADSAVEALAEMPAAGQIAPDVPWMNEDVPVSRNAAQSPWLLIVSAAVLATAILFAKFYKSNR